MRASTLPGLLAVAILAAALLPSAAAQTVINPIEGTWEETYLVFGRVLDSDGKPASGADILVDINQPGVQLDPTPGKANCKGDFIISFKGLRQVVTGATAVVTVVNPHGGHNVTTESALDPFFRRTDVPVSLPDSWTFSCDPAKNPPFENVVSVAGRLVNRTDAYRSADATYFARPYTGWIVLHYTDTSGRTYCAPDGQGGCEPTRVDERGDFKYTWTFPKPIEAGGHVTVEVYGHTHNVTVDPDTRLAVAKIDLTGQGPPDLDTPGPGAALALAAIAIAAVATARRLLPRPPR